MDAGLVRHGSAFGSLVPSDRSAWSWPGSTRLAWTQSSGGCGGSTQLHSASRAVPQDPPPARPAPGGRGRQRRALVPRVRAAGRRGSNGRVLLRYPLGDTEGTWRCPRGVWASADLPNSRSLVGGSALGRGRDCAFASEEA